MRAYPLVRTERLDAVVASSHGRRITAAELLGEAAALAAALPDRPYVINLCRDRYRFTLGLLAALMRGQPSLLPPNETPLTLGQLASDYPGLYGLVDQSHVDAPFPTELVPAEIAATPAHSTPEIAAEQEAVILFTSGSTGRPKPNEKQWGHLVELSRAAGRRLGVDKLRGATVIGSVPHQHAFGLESTVLLPLQHGLIVEAGRPFYPADVAAALAASPRPRILVTTPIHLRALILDQNALPAADLLICATAPLQKALAAEAEAKFQAPLMEIYGCSETGQLAARRTVDTDEWRCLDGIVLRQDAQGTWAGGGPLIGETLLNDVIELVAPDRFHLLGRTADLVNIAGKRSSLAYLNVQLNSVPGVRDGVFVMPEAAGTTPTRLMAFAVAPGLTADFLLAELRRRIDPAFLPRPLCLVDTLPRSPSGKLPREQVERLVAMADAS